MVVGTEPRPTDRHVPHPLTPRPPPNLYSADRQGNWLWQARSPAVEGKGGNARRTPGTTRGGGARARPGDSQTLRRRDDTGRAYGGGRGGGNYGGTMRTRPVRRRAHCV